MYQPPKKLNKKIAQQLQASINKQLEAQDAVGAGNFLQALTSYGELIQLLTTFKHISPMALADAYRDYANANYALAKTLVNSDNEKAALHRAQAVLQLQEAILHYPRNAKKSIRDCQQQLTNITKCVAEKDPAQERFSVDITGEFAEQVQQPKETAILYWRKTVLQRFLAAKQEAANEITSPTQAERPKTLIKI